MGWGDNLFSQATSQQDLQRRLQAIITMLNAATEQPGFEEARPFLEEACETLQELLYADQQRQEIMDIAHRAGVTDDSPLG